MFGRVIKAALFAPVAWIIAYVVGRIATPMLEVMRAGPTGSGSKTVEYISLVVSNTLLMFILSLLMLLIAGAVTERRLAGGV